MSKNPWICGACRSIVITLSAPAVAYGGWPLFERGVQLAEQSNKLLDSAELRVRQLAARPDGDLSAEPFEGWQNG